MALGDVIHPGRRLARAEAGHPDAMMRALDRRALIYLAGETTRVRLGQVTGLTAAQLAEVLAASRPCSLASETLRAAVRRAMANPSPR